MRGHRLFERPLRSFSSTPQLAVVGSLPGYRQGEDYEGRLDIVNGIGRSKAELLDNNLPLGATVHVDNFNQQVVIRWPEYSAPDEIKDGIINWNFEMGDLTGWRDLRGNSWDTYVYDRNTPGIKDDPYMPPDGNIAARMLGVGRGDHILESDFYPVVPGKPIMARSLWYQGPSNKDNNNLWTAFQFYTRGKVPLVNGEVRGDRIHDRTNKRRHWSTVNAVPPAGAAWATVRLIAYRRNKRNRLINVDDVETSGFEYSVGVQNGDDFYLTVKVTDSANRVAYWTGIIPFRSIFLTSQLYGLVSQEFLNASSSVSTMGVRIGSVDSPAVRSSALARSSVAAFSLVEKGPEEVRENVLANTAVSRFIFRDPRIVVRHADEVQAISLISSLRVLTQPQSYASEQATASSSITGFRYE